MSKMLTKLNGYAKTNYIFLNEFSGHRRVYIKDDKFFIESNGKIYDVTSKKCYFFRQ